MFLASFLSIIGNSTSGAAAFSGGQGHCASPVPASGILNLFRKCVRTDIFVEHLN